MTFESFGLSGDPFADADPAAAGERRLFAAQAALRAQTALQQAIRDAPQLLGRGGPGTRIVLLVGAAGVGKTTLITTVRPQLEQAGWLVATWNAENAEQQPYVSALSLLETAFAATPVTVHLAAEHLAAAGISVVRPHVGSLDRPTVLIVDDADALIEPTIEDLFQVRAERTLKGEHSFCVVLVGTPALVERCREMDAVTARAARGDEIRLVRLHGLSEEEIEPYLSHRLAAAGGVAARLFTADAMTRIFAYSRGLPAVINRLGQAALALAEARGHHVVEAALLDEAALDCWLDEEKVAYSGIDDLSAEEQVGMVGETETLSLPPTPGGTDALATHDAPPAASAPAAPEQPTPASAAPDAPDAQIAAVAAKAASACQVDSTAAGAPAGDGAAVPPSGPAAPVPKWAALAAFVRARFGTGGRTIAAGAAIGVLLVVGAATLVRQLAEPSLPQTAAVEARPGAAGRDIRSATPAPPESAAAPAPAPPSFQAPSAVQTPPVLEEPAATQTPPHDAADPTLKVAIEAPAPLALAAPPIGDTDSLVERATGLAGRGDIIGARRFLAAAASRGDGRASLLLARTYDPLFFPGSIVSGVRPDREQATRWYAEAERLGEAGAAQRLRALKAEPALPK